jgi:hypothetical protein
MKQFRPMFTDVSDMLKPAEREKAEAWKAKHQTTCARPDFIVVSNVSGFGYRLKVLCQTCGAKEEVTDVASRDPAPKH